MRRLDVPGKLFLAGEYAVLEPGGRGIVLAVDRCLTVDVAASARDRIEIGRWGIDLEDPPAEPVAGAPPRLAFLSRLFARVRGLCAGAPAVHVCARETANDLLARDLGLGTSSAWAVAFARALLPSLEPTDQRVLGVAFAAHHDAQGGRGSGFDVAAAWAGVAIAGVAQTSGPPEVRRLSRRRALHMAAVHTGTATRTGPSLRRFESLRVTRPRVVSRYVAESELAVQRMERALAGEPRMGIIRPIRQADRALTRLARALGGSNPVPDPVRSALRAAGAAVKPSGALGGDCLIMAASNARALERSLEIARRAGFEPLDLGFRFEEAA